MSCAHPRRGRHDDALTRQQPAVKFLLRHFVFTWVRTRVGNQATGRVGIPLSAGAFHCPAFISSAPSSALMAGGWWVDGLNTSHRSIGEGEMPARCQTLWAKGGLAVLHRLSHPRLSPLAAPRLAAARAELAAPPHPAHLPWCPLHLVWTGLHVRILDSPVVPSSVEARGVPGILEWGGLLLHPCLPQATTTGITRSAGTRSQ